MEVKNFSQALNNGSQQRNKAQDLARHYLTVYFILTNRKCHNIELNSIGFIIKGETKLNGGRHHIPSWSSWLQASLPEKHA